MGSLLHAHICAGGRVESLPGDFHVMTSQRRSDDPEEDEEELPGAFLQAESSAMVSILRHSRVRLEPVQQHHLSSLGRRVHHHSSSLS